MAKFLIPLGIIGGVVCAFLLVRSMKSLGNPSPTSVAAFNHNESKAQKPSAGNSQAAYLVYTEHLETWNPLDYVLETVEGGWYALGEMSSKGYVVAVSPKRAKVLTPDGRTAWIVAMREVPLNRPESQPARVHVAEAQPSPAGSGL